MAELTRVKPGETTPDGFPPMFLRAVQQAVRERVSSFTSEDRRANAESSLVHSVDLPRALTILKEDSMTPSVATSSSASASVDNRPSKKMKIESLFNPLPA